MKHETCDSCPNKKAKNGCPCWIGPEQGLMETHVATGQERLITGCFYQVIPKLMYHVIAASNRPAAAMEELRNGMIQVGQMLNDKQKLLLGERH